MRIVLALLLACHGLIHLIGVVRPSPTRPSLEVFWFFALALLVGSSILVLLRNELWPAVALVGVLVSQGVILARWRDAKAGTAVNVALAGIAIAGLATARLRAQTDVEVRALLLQQNRTARVVRLEDVAALPEPVRRWLDRSGVIGAPITHSARVTQGGQMHTSPDGGWFPIEAIQHITTDEPGFVWSMQGRMAAVVPLVGRDTFARGTGEMHITIAGLVDVAFGRGPKIDEGALTRWLAEISWIPSAAIAPGVTWAPIDATHAEATVESHGVRVSATFTFDAEGRASDVTAQRWYGADGPRLPWIARNHEWRRIRGVEIPVRGEIVWLFPTHEFTFFRWTVADIETDLGPQGPRIDPASLGRFARSAE